MIYFVHCALSLIILFNICACCDTRYFKNVCLFLFVKVKALLDLFYMLYNIRRKIKCLCLKISMRPAFNLGPPLFFSLSNYSAIFQNHHDHMLSHGTNIDRTRFLTYLTRFSSSSSMFKLFISPFKQCCHSSLLEGKLEWC